jgi:hypothetical protein
MVHGLLSRKAQVVPACSQAPVAQGIEHPPSKRDVAGSNPAGGATEEWRPVVGFEEWYEVSDLGRVRRIRSQRGVVVGRILKASPNTDGYPHLALTVAGVPKSRTVHTIVADAFLGPRPPKHNVDHKNGVKSDCRLANLGIVTHSENRRRAFALGLQKPVPQNLANWRRRRLALAVALVGGAA